MSLNLLFSIISTALLFNIFKYFKKYKIVTLNAIIVNYIIASGLSFIIPSEIKSIDYALQQPWFPISILLGLFFVLLFQLMAYSSQKIDISSTTIANKITFIFPTAMGILIFDEDWSVLKIIGFFVAITSILLIVEEKRNVPKKSSFIIILILFLGGGLLECLLNFSNKELIAPLDTSIFFGYLFFFAFCFGVLILVWKLIKGERAPTFKDVFWGIILGIPNYFSMYLLLESLDELPSSSVFPIANMGVILISTILSVILFREKISKKKGVALVCSILAILLISFYDIF